MGVVLGIDTAQLERSGLSTEIKRTVPVGNQTMELIRKGVKGFVERARDPKHIIQHQIIMGGGFGGIFMSTIASKYQDCSLAGEKVERGDTHALQCRIQVMSYGGGEQTPGWDRRFLERVIRMAG